MLRCSKNKNINESTVALPKWKIEDLTKCTEIDENDGNKYTALFTISYCGRKRQKVISNGQLRGLSRKIS